MALTIWQIASITKRQFEKIREPRRELVKIKGTGRVYGYVRDLTRYEIDLIDGGEAWFEYTHRNKK